MIAFMFGKLKYKISPVFLRGKTIRLPEINTFFSDFTADCEINIH